MSVKYYVVAYDIPDDRRRNKIGSMLEAYGRRVNYSVFETQFKSDAQIRQLENKLLKFLKPKEDSVRFYNICENSLSKSWSLGEEGAPFEREAIYYF